VIKLISNLDAQELEKELNDLGPSAQIVAIYSIQQKHFAWVRLPESPKAEKKGKK
jgi:hypothetical protein